MNKNVEAQFSRRLTATVVLATVLCATLVAGAFVCMHEDGTASQADGVREIGSSSSGAGMLLGVSPAGTSLYGNSAVTAGTASTPPIRPYGINGSSTPLFVVGMENKIVDEHAKDLLDWFNGPIVGFASSLGASNAMQALQDMQSKVVGLDLS